MNLVPAGINNKDLSITDLSHILQTKLTGKAVGFAYVISYKEHFGTGSSGGFCRLSIDNPSRAMTIFEPYNCASVSKPISSAALMLLLFRTDGVGLNSLMWQYLPSHWPKGVGIKTITFKELLTHHSGFRESARSYQDLKKLIKDGINTDNKKGEGSYNNSNYALLRLIIPKMAKYSIASLKGKTGIALVIGEPIQAQAFADAYLDYLKKNLFDKVGSMFEVDCNHDGIEPTLFYSFEDQSKKGKNMGDQTLNAGSGGWVMSTSQMAHFFRTLHYTEKIMPKSLSDRLIEEHLGYGIKEIKGLECYYKSGLSIVSDRKYSSLTMGFSNGIQFAIMATSHLGLKNIAWEAFEEWYH